MLAPLSHILPLTTIHRERLLPLAGRVTARLEQKVSPVDVVAEASLGREHVLLDVGQALGLPPEAAGKLVTCKVGERLEAGRVIAQGRGFVPLPVKVPREGRVVACGGGKVLLEVGEGTLELRAGLPGIVTRIIAGRGVEVTTHGALVQGVWGNGRVDLGLMLSMMTEPGEPLVASRLDVSFRGSVLLAGACSDPEALRNASDLPLRGLVLGSLSPALIGLAAQARFPVLVVDGFGNRPMNSAAYKLLASNARRECTVNAEPYDRATGTRPEVVIPLPISQEPPAPHLGEHFTPGQRVRLCRAPRLGEIATLVALKPGLTTVPSGLRVAAGEVRLEDGSQLVVPLANLEVINSAG
ncbi:MAG: hypothetical protein FJZ96_01335 [Chloroflexi bacterium]|nr:hypothetical protein [Chloroflexota bacterium]